MNLSGMVGKRSKTSVVRRKSRHFQSRSQTHIDLYRLGDSLLGLSGAHVKSLIFLLRRFPAGISPEIKSIDSSKEYSRMNLSGMVGKCS